MQNERYDIITPEQVKITYSIAGIGTRSLAVGIDLLIQTAAAIAMLFGFLYMRDTGALSESLYTAGLIIALSVIFFVYFIIFETVMSGRTPGKAATGIRVIQTNGRPVSFYGALMRNLFRLFDFLPAFYGVGVIEMFINRNSRRIGDIVAGTVVVVDRTKARRTPKSLDALLKARERDRVKLRSRTAAVSATPSAAASPSTAHTNKSIPLYPLTPAELTLISDFLRRAEKLKRRPRNALAEKVASPLYDKFHIPAGKRTHHFEFLSMLYRENSG